MRKIVFTAVAGSLVGLGGIPSFAAADDLKVSVWGGNWQELTQDTAGACYEKKTGEKITYITGGTIDRLTKAKLAAGSPETDVTITTSHVGWLYVSANLFEELDMSRIEARADMSEQAFVSPYHIGAFTYVYTIGWRTDLMPEGTEFASWADLWKPDYKGMLGMPDFDPSHMIAVSAILEGASPQEWQKGSEKLKALKPNVKAFFNSDATGQNMIVSGETPVQVMLSTNAYYQQAQGVPIKLAVPKEGAVVGLDTVSIDKGSKNLDKAYIFINCMLEPQAQAVLADKHKLGPLNVKTKMAPETAALPGMFMPDQLDKQIIVDAKLRAEKLNEWRTWFAENMRN